MDFISQLSKNSIAKANNFLVVFDVATQTTSDTLSVYCETCSMPGKGYTTTDTIKTGGPLRKMPYSQIFNDMEITFKLDESMKIKEFIDEWHDSVMDQDTYMFNWYQDYAQNNTMKIHQLNSAGVPTYTILIHEVYPLTINEIQLDYNNADSIQKLTVAFAYRYWTVATAGNIRSDTIEEQPPGFA